MRKLFLFVMMMGSLIAAHADPVAMGGACGSLTVEEQTFASTMSPANQQMFCSSFSQSMRDSAMNMSGMTDSYGNMMSPDQAVEKVARDNNMPMANGTKGGCPVK